MVRMDEKAFFAAVVGAVIYLAIMNCFPVDKKFGVVRLGGSDYPGGELWTVNERPSRMEYKIELFKDAILGKTCTATLDLKDVKAGQQTYHYTVRQRHGSISRNGRTNYFAFDDGGDGCYVAVLLNEVPVKYVLERQEMAELLSDKIVVEYYPNSGFVKRMDGCNPYQQSALEAVLVPLREKYAAEERQKRLEEETREREEEARRQEENRRIHFRVQTMLEEGRVGHSLSDLKKEFEKASVPFEYEVVYVSTEHYAVGEIAFYDHARGTLYVVKDQDREEMTEVPYFGHNATAAEIKAVLEKSGILYECAVGDDAKSEEELRLNTYYCGPGTLIPRAYVYWFSVK